MCNLTWDPTDPKIVTVADQWALISGTMMWNEQGTEIGWNSVPYSGCYSEVFGLTVLSKRERYFTSTVSLASVRCEICWCCTDHIVRDGKSGGQTILIRPSDHKSCFQSRRLGSSRFDPTPSGNGHICSFKRLSHVRWQANETDIGWDLYRIRKFCESKIEIVCGGVVVRMLHEVDDVDEVAAVAR